MAFVDSFRVAARRGGVLREDFGGPAPGVAPRPRRNPAARPAAAAARCRRAVGERLAALDEQLEATPGPIGELAVAAVSGLAEFS